MCYNGNMKRIDVLKGIEQILVQKAYETGHISHRADGDWQKQADGSWKPYTGQSNQSAPQTQEPATNTKYSEIIKQDFESVPNSIKDKMFTIAQQYKAEWAEDSDEDIRSMAEDDVEAISQMLWDNADEETRNSWLSSENSPTANTEYGEITEEDLVETPEKSYGDDEVDYTYAKDIDYSQYDDDIKSIEFRENDDGEFEPHDDDYFRVADKIYEQTDREDMSDEEADQLYNEIVDRVIDRAYELHNSVQKSAVRDMRSVPTTKNMGF